MQPCGRGDTAHPGTNLHVILGNYGTHKHPEVRKWLAEPANRRITFHSTPASCSWLNMAEVFFGIITRQAIPRGTFRNVKDLTGAIGRFIDAYNQRCQPFAWTRAPRPDTGRGEQAQSPRPRRRHQGHPVSRRQYVARGVPGGYRIWDNKRRRWWGDQYEVCPDALLDELNGDADYKKITALLKRYRAQKR